MTQIGNIPLKCQIEAPDLFYRWIPCLLKEDNFNEAAEDEGW